MRVTKLGVGALGGAVVLVWFATGVAAAAEDKPLEFRRSTPFLQTARKKGDGNYVPANTYTRLTIEADYPTDSKYIPYRKRSPLLRFVVGKKYTFATVLTSEIGAFKDTSSIYARDYSSSSSTGESFTRISDFDRNAYSWVFPSGGIGLRGAKFKVRASMQETTSTDISARSLEFLQTALKAVAPTSAVVTTLTQTSMEKVAAKIDEQAGRLFNTSAKEEVNFDIDLGSTTIDGPAMTDAIVITLIGPEIETESVMENAPRKAPLVLGRWTVKLATGRPSIFSDAVCDVKDECADARAKAFRDAMENPSSVLNFRLVDNTGNPGTIQSILAQEDWWSPGLQGLAGDAKKLRDFEGFCRKVRDAVVAVGLTELDGRIVAAAISDSGLLPTDASDEMAKHSHQDCHARL